MIPWFKQIPALQGLNDEDGSYTFSWGLGDTIKNFGNILSRLKVGTLFLRIQNISHLGAQIPPNNNHWS
jgi:hypothetical protein